MLVKVCGMAREENVMQVAALSPDMMGFIFYRPSPRNAFGLRPEAVSALDVSRVGVFVNEGPAEISRLARLYDLTHVQLHGEESPEMCERLRDRGLVVMKAFGIAEPDDLALVRQYDGVCDMYIFDTKTPAHGGSGRRFDHSLLDGYDGRTPFLLSGGIGPEDAGAVCHPMCAGVDVNSRFEVSPGMKDVRLLGHFIGQVKKGQD